MKITIYKLQIGNYGILKADYKGRLDFSNVKVNFPPQMEEQLKINEFIDTIDKRIEIEERRLEKLKEYRTGLIQQLCQYNKMRFPEFEESGDWKMINLQELQNRCNCEIVFNINNKNYNSAGQEEKGS